MATGDAGHSAAAVLPPHTAQPDLLDQLAVGADPYINSAYWHRTWLLVLLGLEPARS